MFGYCPKWWIRWTGESADRAKNMEKWADLSRVLLSSANFLLVQPFPSTESIASCIAPNSMEPKLNFLHFPLNCLKIFEKYLGRVMMFTLVKCSIIIFELELWKLDAFSYFVLFYFFCPETENHTFTMYWIGSGLKKQWSWSLVH